MPFDANIVSSVIDHMNEDHRDACLAIVQAHLKNRSVAQATLVDLDHEALIFSLISVEGDAQTIRIEFSKPLRSESQIRGILVGMTKQARHTVAGLTE